ncbi:MAG: hypothetical protein ACC656_08380 [Candidatus Heimdallarchaeota archaeon]
MSVKLITITLLSNFIFSVNAQNTETSTVEEPALYLFTQIGLGLLLGSFMFMFVMILSVRAIRKQIISERRRSGE